MHEHARTQKHTEAFVGRRSRLQARWESEKKKKKDNTEGKEIRYKSNFQLTSGNMGHAFTKTLGEGKEEKEG